MQLPVRSRPWLVNPRDARRGINNYLNLYNHERPHQSLGYQTPVSVYHRG
ncbi:hypothetical protein C0674_04960 [Sporolactobacillus terrae]|uniref:Integrase catalytic domain-containing protein n=1 Tax=Sporolactobacillus terrae TaxID=269673 RepID=A0ABX5Q5U3_9BACL|nr:hypothetical protein C0674_04960 [Sporolactobacillus terrae]QAA24988.1 hypothetical protein C0679_04935 [Sporolactobacillus terrae]